MKKTNLKPKNSLNPKGDKLTFKEMWNFLKEKYPELSYWSFTREVRAKPWLFGAVRRPPTKKGSHGGKRFFIRNKVEAYQPYRKC